MCFNKELSLLVFILGTLTAIKVGFENPILVALPIFFVSLMQLIEYVLWDNQSQTNGTCNNTNDIASKILPSVIILQFASQFFSKYRNWMSKLFFVIALILMIVAYVKVLQPDDEICSFKNDKNQRLSWGAYDNLNKTNKALDITVTFMYIFGWFCWSGPVGKVIFMVSIVSSLIYNHVSGIPFEENNVANFGSLWCFLAVLMIVFYGIFSKQTHNFVNIKKLSDF